MRGSVSDISVGWMTSDGYIDMSKLPLGSVFRDASSGETDAVQNALFTLASAAGHGRADAAVFLLGFLVSLSHDDWQLRSRAVEALRPVKTPACADLLLGELRRVKSSNTTRRYLAAILDTLASFPADLVARELEVLERDPAFSAKMREKLRACRLEAEWRSGDRW